MGRPEGVSHPEGKRAPERRASAGLGLQPGQRALPGLAWWRQGETLRQAGRHILIG